MEDSKTTKIIDKSVTSARIFQSSGQDLECVCRSIDYTCTWKSKQDDTSILECRSCGLKRTYPVPDSGPSAQIYQDTEITYPIKTYIENKDLWRFFGSKILKEVYKYKNTGNLLDIGCFIGILLEMAKEQGWNTYGVEINQGACEYARSQLGLDVFQGELDDARFPDSYFDTVVCNHVLEHINDPISFLAEIKRILKPDGLLVVGVPNIESWIAKYYGHRWYALGSAQHIWQFCPSTLGSVLKQCGFLVRALTVDLLWYEYPFNPKGLVKRTLFQLIKTMGKGDTILTTAVLENR